jgi:SMODS and SLOG-associating 2TM effector domain 1
MASEISMTSDEFMEHAKAAIGAGQTDDGVLSPTGHAAALESKAPALCKILRGSQPSTAGREYERKDSDAIKAQLLFKKIAGKANWAVFVTACLSAAMLVAASLAGKSHGIFIILGCCGIVSGSLGSMWLFEIRQGNLFQAWMNRRARAEAERVKYFELVTLAAGNSEPSEVPVLLLQLEYFRRYQLEVQRRYYGKRSHDHQRAADRMLTLSAYAAGFGALATGFAGILGGVLGPRWACLAGFATVASALSAFASTNETLGQHRRNEELYDKTNDALAELEGKLDEVRAAAAKDDRESVKQFVSAVHEQLSIEHKQWLDAAENMAASLANLDKALAEAKSKPADSNSKPGP